MWLSEDTIAKSLAVLRMTNALADTGKRAMAAIDPL